MRQTSVRQADAMEGEPLSHAECRRRLMDGDGRRNLGALLVDAGPATHALVAPYWISGIDLVVEVPDSYISRLADRRVSFEIDGVDKELETGICPSKGTGATNWKVSVVGFASELSRVAASVVPNDARTLRPGHGLLRLNCDAVTGRRMEVADASPPGT
jgi:hypothetical protein